MTGCKPGFFILRAVARKTRKRKTMPDQPNIPPAEQVSTPPAPPATQGEHMIPKSRLDEVLALNKTFADRLAALEQERKDEVEKRLAEQNQWKELAEKRGAELTEAQGKAAKVAEYEKTLESLLEKQVGEIPEEKRALIPTYGTTQQRLEWIAANRAILTAPKPFDIGAGKQGGAEGKKIELTAEELEVARKFGMTPEDYAKYK
jgi:type IV secretory pathway VirB10-like protein